MPEYVVSVESMRVITADNEEEAKKLAKGEFIELLQRDSCDFSIEEEFPRD